MFDFNLTGLLCLGGILLLGSLFDVEFQSYLLFLCVGAIALMFKLFANILTEKELTARQKRRQRLDIAASVFLTLILSLVVTPTAQINLKLHPLTSATLLVGCIIAGERAVFIILQKITGIELHKTTEPNKQNEK